MIATTEQLVQEYMKDAIECAKNENQPKLVSLVKKVRPIDPLIFYANGHDQFYKERFFWKDPNSYYTFVGLGYAHTICTNAADERYFHIENEWKRFIKEDLYKNSQIFPDGTGPLLFGGFSFDPNQYRENYWSDFPSSKFMVPTVLYTQVEKEAYLTVNMMIKGQDSVKEHINYFEEIQKLVLFEEYDGDSHTLPVLLEKEEIEVEKFKENVEKATTLIKQQDIEKVVLARQLKVKFSEDISTEYVLQRLLKEQPTSYTYILEGEHQHFIGASPERLVQKQGNYVFSTCLAGSIPRGKTRQEDHELGEELLQDPKNLIEHDVVVHMIKEAMNSYCYEVEIPDHPSLYKTKHIQHLYTPVKGRIKEDVTLFSFIEKLHPTPALGGYPQQEALPIIRKLESFDRGWYAAPLGWVDINGNGEFIVGIRSAAIQQKEAILFAGCGIVADSIPESEYEETKIKFNPMLSALGGIMRGTH